MTEPFECTAPGDTLEVEFAFLNSGVGNATGARVGVQLPPGLVGVPGSCSFTGGSSGDCTLAEGGLIWIGNIPGTPAAPANLLTVNFKVRVRGGTPVSYTHLDVYKRQVLNILTTSEYDILDSIAGNIRIQVFIRSLIRRSKRVD